MLFTGSDLKALCSEAVLKALRRVYPQVYDSEHALVIDPKNVSTVKFHIHHIHILVVIALFKLGVPTFLCGIYNFCVILLGN